MLFALAVRSATVWLLMFVTSLVVFMFEMLMVFMMLKLISTLFTLDPPTIAWIAEFRSSLIMMAIKSTVPPSFIRSYITLVVKVAIIIIARAFKYIINIIFRYVF